MNIKTTNSGFIKTVYSFLILFLISVINVSAQGTITPTPFIDLQYGYDPAGNVTSVINHIDPENTAFMDYDSLDRLIRSSGPWGNASYQYDPLGNRTEKEINDELFNYGYKRANNHLESVVHDRNGNVIADDKYRYTYDSQNRLTEVRSADDLVAAYQYDAFGRRISKTDRDGNTTYYAYGKGLNVLTEFSQDGVPESDYVYAGKTRIAKIDFDIIGSPKSPYFYHTNHLGSNISVTDRITDEIWDNEYLPFGSSLNTDIKNITEIQHQYSSKELDEYTGLYYFGARYYNPETGRFMSVDPAGIDITNPQSWNRYAYVQNNPYTFVDPDGRQMVRFDSEEDAQNFDPTSLVGPLGLANVITKKLSKSFIEFAKTTFKNHRFKPITLKTGKKLRRAFELGNNKPIGSFVTTNRTASKINNTNDAIKILALDGTSNTKPNRLVTLEVIEEFDALAGFIDKSSDRRAFQIVIDRADLNKLKVIEGSEIILK